MSRLGISCPGDGGAERDAAQGRCGNRARRGARLPAGTVRPRGEEAQEAREGHDHLALQAGTPGQPLRARLLHDSVVAIRSDHGYAGREGQIASGRSTASTSIPPSATTRAPTRTSRSIQRSARSRSTRRRATASTAACSRPCTDRSPCRGSSAAADHGRSAADRLRRRARRLEDLSAQVQPGPRRGPDRALPGHLRPAGADPPGRSTRRRRCGSAWSRRSCWAAT